MNRVIAIHGLHSSFGKTWCEQETGNALVPWIGDLLPSSRVLAYEDTLDFSSDKSLLDRFALRQAATTLLAEISRKVDKSVSGAGSGRGQ